MQSRQLSGAPRWTMQPPIVLAAQARRRTRQRRLPRPSLRAWGRAAHTAVTPAASGLERGPRARPRVADGCRPEPARTRMRPGPVATLLGQSAPWEAAEGIGDPSGAGAGSAPGGVSGCRAFAGWAGDNNIGVGGGGGVGGGDDSGGSGSGAGAGRYAHEAEAPGIFRVLAQGTRSRGPSNRGPGRQRESGTRAVGPAPGGVVRARLQQPAIAVQTTGRLSDSLSVSVSVSVSLCFSLFLSSSLPLFSLSLSLSVSLSLSLSLALSKSQMGHGFWSLFMSSPLPPSSSSMTSLCVRGQAAHPFKPQASASARRCGPGPCGAAARA